MLTTTVTYLLASWLTMASPGPVRIIVGFGPGDLRHISANAKIQKTTAAMHGTEVMRLPYALVLDVANEQEARAQAATLPEVRWIEVDKPLHLRLRTLTVPNDEFYDEQWYLYDSDQADADADMAVDEAWTITRGSRDSGPVIVSILDDGFELEHPDLEDRFISDGRDYTENPPLESSQADQFSSHGTEVAGIIAANDNNEIGIAGICPLCKILPVHLLDDDETDAFFLTGSTAAAGLTWAVDEGAEVINNSWGPADGDPLSSTDLSDYWPAPQVFKEAIQYAVTEGRDGLGTIIVWAAGNGDEPVNLDGFASDPRVIAVGSNHARSGRSFYSDYGTALRLLAPSGDTTGSPKIYTTDLIGSFGVSSSDYTSGFNGTSASSPMVAGIVGLMLAEYPTLTAAQVFEALIESAVKINPDAAEYDENGHSRLYGFGRADALGALNFAATYTDDHTFNFEMCDNGLDDNGNNTADESSQCTICRPTFYNASNQLILCSSDSGFSCGRELCDGVDNNCDGRIDEDLRSCSGSTAGGNDTPNVKRAKDDSGGCNASSATQMGLWCIAALYACRKMRRTRT